MSEFAFVIMTLVREFLNAGAVVGAASAAILFFAAEAAPTGLTLAKVERLSRW